MTEDMKYSAYDIKLAHMFGEFKGEVSGELRGIKETVDDIKGYTKEHNKEHDKMWKKVDKNSKFITSITAVIGFVMFVLGTWWKLFKDKVIGG